jgi:hypothetical protein
MSVAQPLQPTNTPPTSGETPPTTIVRHEQPRAIARGPLAGLDKRGLIYGGIAALLNLAAIYIGSEKLRHFDPALVAYTVACVLSTFGVVYRYTVWLEKPPTAMYWKRGWQIFFRPKQFPGNVWHLVEQFFQNFVLQTFIERRSHLRWMAHFLISWGCLAACAITFPLVFGWIHFDPDPADPTRYVIYALWFRVGSFPALSVFGWILFHALDFCAIAIIIGMALAFRRRLYDPGAMTVQQFAMDFLPLILLFAVCVTGLMLTVSALWMHGHSYSFLAVLHAFSVIVTLLYLPFGKFFHIFQRPANIGVQFYKREGRSHPLHHCASCGEEYATEMQVGDLKEVLDDLGYNYRYENGTHYQDICPRCRRRMLAVNQLEALEENGESAFI